MSVDLAKRVVALQRTRASYGAMRQKDLITDAELAFLVKSIETEIANIRSQGDLFPSKQGVALSAGQAVPGGAAKAGAKG